jgi:hypothetical protein
MVKEQIQELARQAANGMLSYDAEGEWRLSEKEAEKFAESIIKECAGLVQGVPIDTMGYLSADQKIKQHFGVE